VNDSLDSLNKRVNLFEFIEMYFAKESVLELYTRLAKKRLIGRFFKNLIVKKMIFIYDVSTSLIEVITELKSHAEKIPIQPFAIDSVLEEFDESRKKAHDHLSKLEDQFLWIIKYITTKRHVTKILMAQRQFVTERYDRGILEAKEYEKLSSEIDKKLQNLNKLLKVKWEAPTFSNFITASPILDMLAEEDIEKIIESSKKVVFQQEENMLTEGEEFDGVYLITKGEVEISYNEKISRRGVGHVISFVNLVAEDCISRINCVALNEVEAYELNGKALKEIMKENPQFEIKIYKEAFMNLTFKSQGIDAEIHKFKEGEIVNLSQGAFIFSGTLKRNRKIFGQYNMVPKNGKTLIAQSNGVLLKFSNGQALIRKEDENWKNYSRLDSELRFNQIKEL